MSSGGYEKPEDRIKRLMAEAAEKPSNVTDFFAAARKRGRDIEPPAAPVLQITGNNNAGVVGNNNNVQINVKVPRGSSPNVTPGAEHISDTQAAEIKELVDKVASVSGYKHQFIWSTIKRIYRFTKYQLLTPDKYEEVRVYLRKWIASSGQPVVSSDSDAGRKRSLARIHAEAKKRKGLLGKVYAFVNGRFGTDSLSELTVGQLNEVIRQFNF